MAESTTSDFLTYLFGYYVFYWGEGNVDNLRGEEFYGKNLLLISLFCRVMRILPVSYKNEEVVNEFPLKIIRSARFRINSIFSASSVVRPVCQTGAAYSITGRITAIRTIACLRMRLLPFSAVARNVA